MHAQPIIAALSLNIYLGGVITEQENFFAIFLIAPLMYSFAATPPTSEI